MEEVTFILETTPAYLGPWLERATLLWYTQPVEWQGKRYAAHQFRQETPTRWGALVTCSEGREGQKMTIQALGKAVEVEALPLASERLQVTARCSLPLLLPLFWRLLGDIALAWPEAKGPILAYFRARGVVEEAEATESHKAKRTFGPHGGTLDRVKEARELMEKGIPKTKACKRAGIDPRTYDRYLVYIIDWEEEAEG